MHRPFLSPHEVGIHNMAQKISHIRTGDLATYHSPEGVKVPVRVTATLDGNTASFVVTADREGYVKGATATVKDNLTTQRLRSRKAAEQHLLVTGTPEYLK